MGWICSLDVLSTYIAPDFKNMTYNFIKVVNSVNYVAFSLPFSHREQLFSSPEPKAPGELIV